MMVNDVAAAGEGKDQQSFVGTAGRLNGDNGNPRECELCGHPRPSQRAGDRRQRVDHRARQHAGKQAESPEAHHGGEREPIDLDGLCCRRGAQPSEKDHAKGLDEASRGQRGGERQQRAVSGNQDLETPLRQIGAQ